jgi:hypothetical protein
MAKEAVIIGNPNSGSAGEEGYLERFAEALRAGGLTVEVLTPSARTTPLSSPPRPATGSSSPPAETGR